MFRVTSKSVLTLGRRMTHKSICISSKGESGRLFMCSKRRIGQKIIFNHVKGIRNEMKYQLPGKFSYTLPPCERATRKALINFWNEMRVCDNIATINNDIRCLGERNITKKENVISIVKCLIFLFLFCVNLPHCIGQGPQNDVALLCCRELFRRKPATRR